MGIQFRWGECQTQFYKVFSGQALKMRKSWLDGLGPRRSIPSRKQGEGLVRNDKLFCSSEHRDVHRKWGEVEGKDRGMP